MANAEYYVYILANIPRTIYVGVTNDIRRRVIEHKQGESRGFTKRYGVNRLVYYETSDDVTAAIQREKQLKGWVRRKKVQLIEQYNPTWRDLSLDWES
jgi:putative endonuclease